MATTPLPPGALDQTVVVDQLVVVDPDQTVLVNPDQTLVVSTGLPVPGLVEPATELMPTELQLMPTELQRVPTPQPVATHESQQAETARVQSVQPAPAQPTRVDPDGYIRFGPGVPGLAERADVRAAGPDLASVLVTDPLLAQPERSRPEPAPERPQGGRLRTAVFVISLLLIAAEVVYVVAERVAGSVLSVQGVTAYASSGTASCDTSAAVTAVIRTNGAAGTLSYWWTYGDQRTPVRQLSVQKGGGLVDAVLQWRFDGPGSDTGTATITIEGTPQLTASANVTYQCRQEAGAGG